MSYSILIVDDTPDSLRLLTRILTEHQFRLQASTKGSHALMSARKDPPDLILLDIRMPGMDGYEVCQELKAHPTTSEIPIIFLSSLDEVDDKLRAFEVGGADYIIKPFQEAEVLARIETQLEMRRLRDALNEKNQTLLQLNETLEEKVAQRTAELAKANQALQDEIEQRVQYQEEKDKLFAVVSQQGEQLRNMTSWLIQFQQTERQGMANNIQEEMSAKLRLLKSTAHQVEQLLPTDQMDLISENLKTTFDLIEQLETYMIQFTSYMHQPTSQEQEISESPLLKLTEREREVLKLIADGKRGSQIANILSISSSSVHTYIRRIKDKLAISELSGLVRFALENELAV